MKGKVPSAEELVLSQKQRLRARREANEAGRSAEHAQG